jgi:thiamine-monophosphate kinase
VLVEEGVRCAIDISDGLVADLGHVCACSGVSATVNAASVPMCSVCADSTPDASRFALTGGEDYELLFTCNTEQLARIGTRLSCRVTAIGRIDGRTASPGVAVVDTSGRPFEIGGAGWNHFGR